MQRFIRTQRVSYHYKKIADTEMLQLLPSNNEIVKSCSFAVNSDSELLTLLELSQGTLDFNRANYSDTKYVKLLKPHVELIFDSHEIAQLHSLYQQLNPNCSIEYLSPFYTRSGRISIGGEILGSTLNKCSAFSSSTIAAYWPSEGNRIAQFSESHKSIGKVLHYFTQDVIIKRNDAQKSEKVQYAMACVQWMETHPESSFFGISAVVCENYCKESSLCSFIPVLRILAKCANCKIIHDHRTVFVACPINIKFCV